MVNGASDSIPLIKLAYDLLNGMEFLAHPDGVERMNVILDQTSKLLFKVGCGRREEHLVAGPVLSRALMDILLPISYFQGSFAPVYDRLWVC